MVLWTGNGYHIYVIFSFEKPLEEQYQQFSKCKQQLLSNINISEEFLKFAKKQLTNGKADPANNPSFNSMFLRIPGSINTKYFSDNLTTLCLIKGL